MKAERIKNGYCVKSGDKYIAQWYEPQFTSYYLVDEFKDSHFFDSKQKAIKEIANLKLINFEILNVKITYLKEII